MGKDPHLHIRIDTSQWHDLAARLRAFEPGLLRGLRKNLKVAADDAVQAVRDVLAEPTPGGNAPGAGLEALSAGTRVTVSFSKRMAGVRIVTSGARLPEGHAELLRLYNLESFRHPVFGNKTVWVAERGRPYFYKPILHSLGKTMEHNMNLALEEAIAAVRR